MAISEAFSHIDPIEHLRRVSPDILDMTSDEQQQRGRSFDDDLMHANPGLMLRLVSEAYQLYPGDPSAQEGYIRGSQVGINFMREVWASQNLAEIVPFDTLFEIETIPDDGSGA